jgi:hypothetical protein
MVSTVGGSNFKPMTLSLEPCPFLPIMFVDVPRSSSSIFLPLTYGIVIRYLDNTPSREKLNMPAVFLEICGWFINIIYESLSALNRDLG